MKKIINVLLLSCMMLLVSCSSIYKFNVETKLPAKITLPLVAPSVVVVNNALPQPDSVGFITYVYKLKAQQSEFKGNSIIKKMAVNESVLDSIAKHPSPIVYDTIPVEMKLSSSFTDSLLWTGVKTVSYILNESDLFSEVLLFGDTLRKDKEWFKTKTIPEETINDICIDADADIVLSIDRMLFSFAQTLSSAAYNTNSVTTLCQGSITCSIYMYEKEKKITSFVLSDTILEKNIFEDLDSMFIYKEVPEAFLLAMTLNLGNKLAEQFIPQWKNSERLIFTNQNSRMKEALAFAKANKWGEALQDWINLFDNESDADKRTKARLAQNIALAYEMQDLFDESLIWLEKSTNLYSQIDQGKNKEEIAEVTKYLSELKERIQMNNILDIQYGNE